MQLQYCQWLNVFMGADSTFKHQIIGNINKTLWDDLVGYKIQT